MGGNLGKGFAKKGADLSVRGPPPQTRNRSVQANLRDSLCGRTGRGAVKFERGKGQHNAKSDRTKVKELRALEIKNGYRKKPPRQGNLVVTGLATDSVSRTCRSLGVLYIEGQFAPAFKTA